MFLILYICNVFYIEARFSHWIIIKQSLFCDFLSHNSDFFFQMSINISQKKKKKKELWEIRNKLFFIIIQRLSFFLGFHVFKPDVCKMN